MLNHKLEIALFSLLVILTICLVGCSSLPSLLSGKVSLKESTSQPITHELWNELLQKHVHDGLVDYKGIMQDSLAFNQYLDKLSSGLPNKTNWSEDQEFAYWVNAYNAFTVKIILDHYPTQSIKDIKGGLAFVNTVWDHKFIEIEGQKFDLNNIEHSILRKKYNEPRIHFVVNCASISCPNLLDEAYEAETLEAQLMKATNAFLTDTSKNIIGDNELKLSKIFSWYKGDFVKEQTLVEFLNQYVETPINENAKISHLDYDWNLNEYKG